MKSMETSMPTIALCLIAKNESAMIGDCLASVKAAVDQMVVVDTGSNDNTIAIAQAHGADVVHFEWCDDFSAARNAALPHVRCDWVLILDCDERLASGAAQAIRAAVNRPRAEAFLLPLTDAVELNASPDAVVNGSKALRERIWLPRLFRMSADLRWEGRVHEHLESWMERRGGHVASLNAPIAHYGAVPEYRIQRGNSSRNLKLLVAELEENPRLWFARTYLLEELIERNQASVQAEAEVLWTQIQEELLPAITAGRAQHAVVKALTACMVAFARKGDFQAVLQVVSASKAVGVDHPNLDFMEGLAHENRSLSDHGADSAQLILARDAYFRVLQGEDQVWVDALIGGIRSWNGFLRLSTVLLQLGHPDDALEGFVLAGSQTDQAQEEIAMGRAEALIALGRAGEALALIHPFMEANPQSCDAAILAAAACECLGRRDAASDFWLCAANTAREGLKGLHRLQRLNAGLAAMAS
jgi:hypothetical protein